MAFTKVTADPANISKLSNRPNQNDGLSAAQLKGRFDKAGVDLAAYLNDVLTEELEQTTDGGSGADNIGATAVGDGTATTVQGVLEELDIKSNDIDDSVVHKAGAEVITGNKIFDQVTVFKKGMELVAGDKIFSGQESDAYGVKITTENGNREGGLFIGAGANDNGGPESRKLLRVWDREGWKQVWHEDNDGHASGLDADTLDGKHDADMVHKAGNETITDQKTFSVAPVVPTPTVDGNPATKKYTDDLANARYTKTNLHTEGQALVHWGNLTNVPNLADASWKTSVATKTALPVTGNVVGDQRVVLDDGDGKQAVYTCVATTGTYEQQWAKVGDVDWMSEEATRQTQETARQTAEGSDDPKSGRVGAELDRVSAENARILAEGTADPKTGRIGAELDRVDAENARKSAEILRQAHINDKDNPHEVTAAKAGALSTTDAGDRTYTEQNYIADAEPLTTSIDKLDMQLKDTADLISTMSKPYHFDHVKQEYVNVDKFWDGLKTGKIYTSEFNQFSVSPSPLGTKKDDNTDMVCEPSTNTVKGQNDYESAGLFMSIDVNAYVDENDDYHIKAIKGDGIFKNDGTMGDVYVMAMAGYQRRYETDDVWGISYSDTMHGGFEVLSEAVKPDDTIRPYLLHAKYIAGRNPHENNNLASISGVMAEYTDMSHNGQINFFKEKGVQYSGKTSHDDYYVQLMVWIKYAVTSSDLKMRGCQSYYLQYTNLVPEIGVSRVVVTNAQANELLVGSAVSIGDYGEGSISVDRTSTQNFNKANRVNITSIEDLGDGNSAVYVDSEPFDTTLTTTITTYPWNPGGCDNVLGQDGSPYSNQSGKEPCLINGIEMMVGGYEVLQNLIIHNNNVDDRTDVYVNYDCATYATSPTAVYELVGQLATTNDTWQYGSKMVSPEGHPSVMLIVETEGSSTAGTGDGFYTNSPSAGGYRAWLSLGRLGRGVRCGLRCLDAGGSLAGARWGILGRLSATGRSRRLAGVN